MSSSKTGSSEARRAARKVLEAEKAQQEVLKAARDAQQSARKSAEEAGEIMKIAQEQARVLAKMGEGEKFSAPLMRFAGTHKEVEDAQIAEDFFQMELDPEQLTRQLQAVDNYLSQANTAAERVIRALESS